MARRFGNRSRRTVAVSIVAAAALVASLLVFASFAGAASSTTNGQETTFSQVNCTAKVGNGTVNQKQDISVWVVAPDSVSPGETFSVSLPSIPADLPSQAQGLTINSYKNLRTVYRVNGGSVVAGSGTTDGPATINGNPTPAEVDITNNDIMPTIPGPIPPGHLVPPNGTAQVTAGADGTSITISAIEVDTTANVKNIGDVPVQCPVPANTLTTTQVGTASATTAGPTTTGGPTTTAGPTTTVAPTTTTSVPHTGGGAALQCATSGTVTIKPGLTATSTASTKASTLHVTIKGTMTGCTGGPAGVVVTKGTFSATGVKKIAKGAQTASCASLEQASSSIPVTASTSKLQNGSKTTATLKAKGAIGPIHPDSPVTFDLAGTVSTKGPFLGLPLSVHFVTNVNGSSLSALCNGNKAGTKFTYTTASSTYVVGSVPSSTTTTTSTSTTTAAPTTTTTVKPTTTSTSTTTTTAPTNPIPPEAAAAIEQACNQLAAALVPAGIDITPLTIGCAAAVNGQGSVLLQTFLIAPQLGCVALGGLPVLSNPQVLASCIQFATAIQPYSSIIAGLIPTP